MIRTTASAAARDGASRADAPRYPLRFPQQASDLAQDEEWFEVELPGGWRRMGMHDYAAIYAHPGLYESLVYDLLRCRSPRRIVRQLVQVLEDWEEDVSDLRVLDLGAGNGIVAQRLREAGARSVVGLDILPEARAAALRDRPGAYDAYVAEDVTRLSPQAEETLRGARLNALASVAALGFGDIPADAFLAAFEHVRAPGWVAFSIKEDFLADEHADGFAGAVRTLIEQGVLAVQARWRFCHRVSLAGEKLFYVGIVARKERELPGRG